MSERTIKVKLLDGSIVTMNTEERVISYQLAEQMIPLTTDADSVFDDVLAALEEAQQQAELAYAAYEGLQGFCVSRGEYDSLLNKHSVLARAHREAQQTIARKQLYIEKLELSRESTQKAADDISKEKDLELFEARRTIARAIQIYETADMETDFDNVLTGMYEALKGIGEGAKESVALRPEVKWFAEQMENQLRANEHKGGWTDQSYYLISCLNGNFNDLITAVHEVEQQDPGEWREKQRIEATIRAANVGNFAMMLADNAKNDRLEKDGEQA